MHNLKKFAISAGVAGILSVGTIALADAPVLNILTITGADVSGVWTPGSDLTVNTTPTIVTVGGSVTHDPNLNPISAVNLYVNDVLNDTEVIPNGSGSTFNFALDWSIPSAGDYTLKVTAKHGNCGDCTGSDEEVLTVIDLNNGGGGNPPGVNCPAAPAVATAYMRTVAGGSVKPGSAVWKNVVNKVAAETGSKGQFWAKFACGGGPNNKGITYADMAAYQAAVKAFVDPLTPPTL